MTKGFRAGFTSWIVSAAKIPRWEKQSLLKINGRKRRRTSSIFRQTKKSNVCFPLGVRCCHLDTKKERKNTVTNMFDLPQLRMCLYRTKEEKKKGEEKKTFIVTHYEKDIDDEKCSNKLFLFVYRIRRV